MPCVPIPEKSMDTVVNAYLRMYTVDSEEVEEFCQIMEANLKIHYFQM